MNMQMERRIRKAEEVVATRQPANRKVKIMCSPDGDVAEEARFHAEVEEAVRDGFFVIRLVSLQPKAAT